MHRRYSLQRAGTSPRHGEHTHFDYLGAEIQAGPRATVLRAFVSGLRCDEFGTALKAQSDVECPAIGMHRVNRLNSLNLCSSGHKDAPFGNGGSGRDVGSSHPYRLGWTALTFFTEGGELGLIDLLPQIRSDRGPSVAVSALLPKKRPP